MNKSIIYAVLAAMAGLLLGYLIFGGNGEADSTEKQEATGISGHSHEGAPEAEVWTCSMHPQIRQAEPGDCPICGMDLIPAGSDSGMSGADQIRMSENAMALANIRTTRVGNGQAASDGGLGLSGKISENQGANSVQASYFDGRVEKLYVTYQGQQVRQGQLLATLYSPNLVAAQQELLTAAPLKESQPDLYRAVRNKLRNWKLTEQQIDEIEASGKVREQFPVYANVTGTVLELMTSEGSYLSAGQPIARLSNLATVWADFDAYESQLKHFRTGQPIAIRTSAYPEKTFDARISFIDPVLDARTRTVTVRATLDNREGLLKPGMFVSAMVEATQPGEDAPLTIPASAVMWTGERSVVYVREQPDQPVFTMREVTLGPRKGEVFEVSGGLQPGEEVVTNGTFTVDAAAQLQGKRSMMNKSGGVMPTGHEGHAGGQNPLSRPSGEMPVNIELSREFQEGFQKAIPPYLKMKDAFVKGMAGEVAAAAGETLSALEPLVILRQGQLAESELAGGIRMLKAIADSQDLENQRMHFVELNEHLVALARNLSGAEVPLYIQHCPMANENQGAVWLSSEREIRNPYYGDAMLTCGSILDSVQ